MIIWTQKTVFSTGYESPVWPDTGSCCHAVVRRMKHDSRLKQWGHSHRENICTVANELETVRGALQAQQILVLSSQRTAAAKDLSTVQPGGWPVGVLLWNWFATGVCHPWGVSFGIPQMLLAPCQHKYGERAGKREGKVPEKLCKSLYHSSPEKPQGTVVSFTVGGTRDATCWWLLVLQSSTFVLLLDVCRNL